MLRHFTSRLPAIAMAGLLVLGLSGRAHADLVVTLNGVSTPVHAGNDQLPFALPAGGFTASGVATGEAVLGPAQMDLPSLTVLQSGTGTATIIFSMNNITSPTGPGTINQLITGSFANGTGTIAYTTYADNSNTLYTTVPNVSTKTGTVTTLGGSSTGSFTATAPYSLTEVLAINFTRNDGRVNLSTDSRAAFVIAGTVVPEPATIGVVLSAMPVLGLYWLRRRRA